MLSSSFNAVITAALVLFVAQANIVAVQANNEQLLVEQQQHLQRIADLEAVLQHLLAQVCLRSSCSFSKACCLGSMHVSTAPSAQVSASPLYTSRVAAARFCNASLNQVTDNDLFFVVHIQGANNAANAGVAQGEAAINTAVPDPPEASARARDYRFKTYLVLQGGSF